MITWNLSRRLVTAFRTRYSVVIKEKAIKKEQAPSRLIELIARHINNELINLRSSFTEQSVDYFFSSYMEKMMY